MGIAPANQYVNAFESIVHELEVMNFILSYVTYGLGVPSGLFVPSLLTGASAFFALRLRLVQSSHFAPNFPHKSYSKWPIDAVSQAGRDPA